MPQNERQESLSASIAEQQQPTTNDANRHSGHGPAPPPLSPLLMFDADKGSKWTGGKTRVKSVRFDVEKNNTNRAGPAPADTVDVEAEEEQEQEEQEQEEVEQGTGEKEDEGEESYYSVLGHYPGGPPYQASADRDISASYEKCRAEMHKFSHDVHHRITFDEPVLLKLISALKDAISHAAAAASVQIQEGRSREERKRWSSGNEKQKQIEATTGKCRQKEFETQQGRVGFDRSRGHSRSESREKGGGRGRSMMGGVGKKRSSEDSFLELASDIEAVIDEAKTRKPKKLVLAGMEIEEDIVKDWIRLHQTFSKQDGILPAARKKRNHGTL